MIIAIALALNPEIIIMDEPTTALDVVVQRDILVELMALREHLNFAVIFITHDLSLLLEVADQVAIMYAGRIVETASWQELYRHARHPYTYGLLNSFPSLHRPKRRMNGIPGSPPICETYHPAAHFALAARMRLKSAASAFQHWQRRAWKGYTLARMVWSLTVNWRALFSQRARSNTRWLVTCIARRG